MVKHRQREKTFEILRSEITLLMDLYMYVISPVRLSLVKQTPSLLDRGCSHLAQ